MLPLRAVASLGFIPSAAFSLGCGGASAPRAPVAIPAPVIASPNEDAPPPSVKDAHELAEDLIKARTSLEALKQALAAAVRSLVIERKFPPDLGRSLASMNVESLGDKLAGRRFSGVSASTMRDLIDFITRVQALDDKKDLVVTLLFKLEKPIADELARPPGPPPVRFVVVLDESVDEGALLLPLVSPILPDESSASKTLKFVNPTGAPSVLPRLTDVKKIPRTGAAVPVVETSFERVCPSATGQIAQLLAFMNGLLQEIQGGSGDPKPGLSDLAQKLSDDLASTPARAPGCCSCSR